MKERKKTRLPFSQLNFDSWQNLILVGLFIFYFAQYGFMSTKESFLRGYGVDYLAFWSIGKIADEKGLAEIYDIENIRLTQIKALEDQGMLEKGSESDISPIPAPIFPFFVLPFQLLSRVDPKQSYWIWTGINLAAVAGYLIFFAKKTLPENSASTSINKILILMLLSFPLVVNLTEGQVEVFLVICLGEFIRLSINQKPLFSGLWLGGLLLKPQLLVIIIPILIIKKYWKIAFGFILTSIVILGSSLLLAGTDGLKSLIGLWFKYGEGIASNSPERMINWRMVAVNLNSSFGWILAISGMVLMLLAVYYLVKNKFVFGSSQWVMVMLGIFSATLAFTWHSHFHMAAVLIPFLIYCSQSGMLNKKVVLYWAVSTPAILMVITIAGLFILLFAGIIINEFAAILLGISGFFSNMFLLGSVMTYFKKNNAPVMQNPGKLTL